MKYNPRTLPLTPAAAFAAASARATPFDLVPKIYRCFHLVSMEEVERGVMVDPFREADVPGCLRTMGVGLVLVGGVRNGIMSCGRGRRRALLLLVVVLLTWGHSRDWRLICSKSVKEIASGAEGKYVTCPTNTGMFRYSMLVKDNVEEADVDGERG